MWTVPANRAKQATPKGEGAEKHRARDLQGEEALATGWAAITGCSEGEVENSKDKDRVQRQGKTETRNGPRCQACFLIPICPVPNIQVIQDFDLQCNKSIDISRSLCIASSHLQINAPN